MKKVCIYCIKIEYCLCLFSNLNYTSITTYAGSSGDKICTKICQKIKKYEIKLLYTLTKLMKNLFINVI